MHKDSDTGLDRLDADEQVRQAGKVERETWWKSGLDLSGIATFIRK